MRPVRPAHIERAIDESALVDALAFLDLSRGTDDEEWAEGMVTSIRQRLDDFGAAVEERQAQGVRFVRAEPYRYDPPGTVRFAVHRPGDAAATNPDDQLDIAFGPGDDPFPRGPRNGGR